MGRGLGRPSHWNAAPRKSSSSRGTLAAGRQGDARALARPLCPDPGTLLCFQTPWSLSWLQVWRPLLGEPYIDSPGGPLFCICCATGLLTFTPTLLPALLLAQIPPCFRPLRVLDTDFRHGCRLLLLFLYFLIISLAICRGGQAWPETASGTMCQPGLLPHARQPPCSQGGRGGLIIYW